MFGENILKLEDYLTIISNSIFSNKKMSLYESSINNNTSSLFLDHLFLAFNNSKTNDALDRKISNATAIVSKSL